MGMAMGLGLVPAQVSAYLILYSNSVPEHFVGLAKNARQREREREGQTESEGGSLAGRFYEAS